MEIAFLPQATEDLQYWKQTGNTRGEQGKWSRSINDKHRLIYSISSGRVYVYVISARFHYSK